MDIAKGLALKFNSGTNNTDDLIQVAYLGLLNAINRFDPSRGSPFQASAAPTIDGELKRHFRDKSSLVRIPRSLYEQISEVDTAASDLGAETSHTPSLADIAEELGTGEEDVREAMEAKRSRQTVSFDAPQSSEAPDLTAAERIGEVDGAFSVVEDHEVLVEAAADLSERERDVLRMRFREEMTQAEIAEPAREGATTNTSTSPDLPFSCACSSSIRS